MNKENVIECLRKLDQKNKLNKSNNSEQNSLTDSNNSKIGTFNTSIIDRSQSSNNSQQNLLTNEQKVTDDYKGNSNSVINRAQPSNQHQKLYTNGPKETDGYRDIKNTQMMPNENGDIKNNSDNKLPETSLDKNNNNNNLSNSIVEIPITFETSIDLVPGITPDDKSVFMERYAKSDKTIRRIYKNYMDGKLNKEQFDNALNELLEYE